MILTQRHRGTEKKRKLRQSDTCAFGDPTGKKNILTAKSAKKREKLTQRAQRRGVAEKKILFSCGAKIG